MSIYKNIKSTFTEAKKEAKKGNYLFYTFNQNNSGGWYRASDGDGTETPEVYGKDPEALLAEGGFFRDKVVIHYPTAADASSRERIASVTTYSGSMSDENKQQGDVVDPNAPIVMKMKKKYLVIKPGNKGSSKHNNGGGVGRRAKAQKRAVAVSAAICPEQYGLWAAWMRKNGFPILG